MNDKGVADWAFEMPNGVNPNALKNQKNACKKIKLYGLYVFRTFIRRKKKKKL